MTSFSRWNLPPKRKRFSSKGRFPYSDRVSQEQDQTMRRSRVILSIVGCTALLIALTLIGKPPSKGPNSPLATLTQTYIASEPAAPVRVPRLITAEGEVFKPERLHGH